MNSNIAFANSIHDFHFFRFNSSICIVDQNDSINAMVESFWGRMQTELFNRKTWTTVVELSMAMADYIENFHNTSRRHSSLAMLTPIEYEKINSSQLQLS